MPLRIRWKSKEYLCIALMLFGSCGLFQLFFIFVAQYLLGIGNYYVVILIPIGITFALFYCTTIIFESFAQVERRRKIKRFKKLRIKREKLRKLLEFPIVRPLLITFAIFSPLFFISYFICNLLLNNIVSFIIAENLPTIICFLIANLIEKNYGRIRRF